MSYGATPEPPPFRFRLDDHSGVPVYRQMIDQVQGAIAMGVLRPGDQLPTVRLVAVELAINPNTVMRAYRELEIRGILDTQQGTGTFVADRPDGISQEDRERMLFQLVGEFVARAGAAGITLQELADGLRHFAGDARASHPPTPPQISPRRKP
ncbi:GntR family transcriptional regulator [Acidobacteria bacterium AB60]|nr:GntR family transcriptional regulator [Acidobacteria bacterium AB60]